MLTGFCITCTMRREDVWKLFNLRLLSYEIINGYNKTNLSRYFCCKHLFSRSIFYMHVNMQLFTHTQVYINKVAVQFSDASLFYVFYVWCLGRRSGPRNGLSALIFPLTNGLVPNLGQSVKFGLAYIPNQLVNNTESYFIQNTLDDAVFYCYTNIHETSN